MEPIGKFRLSKLFIVPHSWLLNYFDSRKKSIILVEKILSKEPMCRNISFEIIHAKNVLCYKENRSKKFCVHFFKCRNFSVVIFPSFFCRKKSIENEKAPVEKIPSKFLRFAMGLQSIHSMDEAWRLQFFHVLSFYLYKVPKNRL